VSSRLATLVDLLHRAPTAALATHSKRIAGYPFASAVAFAPDLDHRPLLLMSGIAEHSRNLQQDPRASLMLAQSLGGGEVARATLVGEIRPYPATPEEDVERYLRYQPEAQRLLALGDFGFCCLDAARIQVIGGFAQAGWLDGSALQDAARFSREDELRLRLVLAPQLAPGWMLLGVDPYGADLMVQGQRERLSFAPDPVTPERLPEAFDRELRRWPEAAPPGPP
jgi:hypothetical protein